MLQNTNRTRSWRVGALLATTVAAALVTPFFAAASAHAASNNLYVSPSGNDSGKGTSQSAPLKTIQHALDLASAGTTIKLAPGAYHESPTTTHDGTAGAPITIQGPETGTDASRRYQATLYGTSTIFSINNSHYVLKGFTIDGQEKISRSSYPTDSAKVDKFKDSIQSKVTGSKLIYIGASDKVKGINDVDINDMFLNGAGGECLRMRDATYNNVVENSTVQWCGMQSKKDGTFRYHNGEAVYIGTSLKSTSQPMYKNDTSHNNIVRDNIIHSFGSECVDVKENAHDNLIENNECAHTDEPGTDGGSNMELRGDHNIVRNNSLTDSRGWNMIINSDAKMYDRGGNVVQGNKMTNADSGHLRVGQAKPTICGNSFDTVGNLPKGPATAYTAACSK